MLNVIAVFTNALDTLEEGAVGVEGDEFWEIVMTFPADQADSAPTLSRACAFTVYVPTADQLFDWLAEPQLE